MLLKELILHLLYPPKCVLCGTLLQERQTDLCTACRQDLPQYAQDTKKPELTADLVAAVYYEGQVRRSLLRYKFEGKSCYAFAYGRMLGMQILRQDPQFDLISWIPVSAKRKRQRGYDQAQLLAAATAAELGRTATPTLKKHRDVPAQSSLKESAMRRANVLGVYQVLPTAQIAGKKILLIDDILTTGATMSEAAKMLQMAGAAQVVAAVLATTRE